MSAILSTSRILRSSPEARLVAKMYRDKRRADGACVNHGDRRATHGCRCCDCYWRHAYGLRPSRWERTEMLRRELVRIAAA